AQLWSGNDGVTELLRLARASDIVFVGRDEAEVLWGTSTASEVRDLIQSPAHLIVKDGGDRAHYYGKHGEATSAAPVIDVVEPVGAGDAFAAGWLSGWLRGIGAEERLRLGHLISSRVLASTTDSGVPPTEDEIAAAISTDPTQWHVSNVLVER